MRYVYGVNIHAINLALFVPVCLHCGELNPDGALFCTKCGFTLPQVEGSPSSGGPSSAPASTPSASTAAPSPQSVHPTAPPTGYSYAPSVSPPVYLTPLPADAVGPIAPPLAGKYCIHCRTIISQAAAYCPVCQRPQA